MKLAPDIRLTWRFARSDEYPFVVELRDHHGRDKQTHRFGDNHSRTEFVLGVRAVGRLLGLRVDEDHKS